MDFTEIVTVLVTALVTGGVSTLSTVAALKVHIDYLRQGQATLAKSIERAHSRLDELKI